MPEQTFRSPNFFEREIDLSAPVTPTPIGVPAGIIGTANKGPAFVPITVGNFSEFVSKFGNLDTKKYGPYAVEQFLQHRSALTYLRVLGAGSNESELEISDTISTDRVKNAGMLLEGVEAPHDNHNRLNGAVQFLVSEHTVNASNESVLPFLTDNDTVSNSPKLVRALFMTPETSRIMVATPSETFIGNTPDEVTTSSDNGEFLLIISSSLGADFSSAGGKPGIRSLKVSLDPSSTNYFAKVMNSDPDKFVQEQHLLYADFPVDAEIAHTKGSNVAVLQGSNVTSADSGDPTLPMSKAFGSYNTRFRSPQTPWIISQPFGATEYDLFRFEALDDGEYANTLYKIAIADLKASIDETDPYGTFTVNVRDWSDTDMDPKILESYPNCTLNPTSANYVAKVIGDLKVSYDFDMTIEDEKRIVTSGKYSNNSKLVRVIVHDDVERKLIPSKTLPFGFRGMSLLKTNPNNNNIDPGENSRLSGHGLSIVNFNLLGSVLPPIPFRTKITRGAAKSDYTWLGEAASTETPISLYHWGVKFERNNIPLNPNISSEKNKLLESYTKFMGLAKLDVLTTGQLSDDLHHNKFTLAKVALPVTNDAGLDVSVQQLMKQTAYLRDAQVDTTTYTITDSLGDRYTFATLLSKLSASDFNKFSQYAKFITFMHGGWDGVNILDRDARRMNDKAASLDGCAELGSVSPGFLTRNNSGAGVKNSTIMSYKTAINIMTDPMVVTTNLLAIPGIRDAYVTDYGMKKVKEYGLSFYVMDIPAYSDKSNRLFDDSTARVNVDTTIKMFDGRSIDNNYTGTYFPDVFIDDATNRRRIKVPASVAALGALAYNDKFAYPWFAPAGFNRASLDFVTNVGVRLNVSDRDSLYDSRINPIATFPRLGYVIYGQKTLQVSKSALDRVNVRRLLLEVKRGIVAIAQRLIFEQNTPEVRNRFVADASLQLSMIQAAAGVEAFQVVMNETNNTQADIEANRLNGRIVVVPTRVIEYIAIDFIITNSGVQFV